MNRHHKGGKLTLTRVYANCLNRGECKLWKGAVSKNGFPSVYDPSTRAKTPSGGGSRSGRVAVWELKTGKKPPAGIKVTLTCGNRLCLEFRHMTLMTPKEVGAQASADGAFRTLRTRVSQLANLQRTAKLSREKVRVIRTRLVSGDDPETVAADYEVSRRHILDIGSGKRWPDRAMPNSSVFNMVGVGRDVQTGRGW